MSGKIINIEDIIPVGSATLFLLMSLWKEYPDAFTLYFRYAVQMRLQNNRMTKSTDKFMENAMGWGHSRFIKAKKLLKDAGLIEVTPIKNDEGKVTEWAVKVLTVTEFNPDVTNCESNWGERWKAKPQKYRKPEVSNSTSIDSLPLNIGNIKEEIISNIKENKEKDNFWNSRDVIVWVIDAIRASGKMYSKWEEIFAFQLMKDSQFIEVCKEYWCIKDCVDDIMRYALADGFWCDKLNWIKGFRYNWGKIYNQMKTNWKIKKRLNKQSEEDFLSILNSV